MRSIYLIICNVIIACLLHGQAIELSLCLDSNSKLNDSANQKVAEILYRRYLNHLTSYNDIVIDPYSNFQMISEVNLNKENMSAAGMKPVIMWNISLSIMLEDRDAGLIFGQKYIEGTSFEIDEVQAMKDFVATVDVEGSLKYEFISDCFNKRVAHYNETCDGLINEAENYIRTNDVLKAIKLLMSIPRESSCYSLSIDDLSMAHQLLAVNRDYKYLLNAEKYFLDGDYGSCLNSLGKLTDKNISQDLVQRINNIKESEIRHSQEMDRKMADIEKENRKIELQRTINERQRIIEKSKLDLERERSVLESTLQQKKLESIERLKKMDLRHKERIEIIDGVENVTTELIDLVKPFKWNWFRIIQ